MAGPPQSSRRFEGAQAGVKPEEVKEELATVKSEDEEVSGMEAEDAEMDEDEDDEGDFEDVKMEGPG